MPSILKKMNMSVVADPGSSPASRNGRFLPGPGHSMAALWKQAVDIICQRILFHVAVMAVSQAAHQFVEVIPADANKVFVVA